MDLSHMSIAELRELQTLVAQELEQGAQRRKSTAIEQINEVAKSVGLSLQEILGDKGQRTSKPRARTQRYVDPVNPSNVWGGSGPRPAWLKSALAAGVPIERLHAQG